MMRRAPWVEIALAAVMLGLLVLLANRQAAQQNAPPTYATYSSYDSYAGGYRAWYELLREEGFKVERFGRHAAYLDPSVDTFIIANNDSEAMARAVAGKPTPTFGQADAEALQAWVRGGGRLVLISDGGSITGEPPPFPSGTTTDEAVPIIVSPLSANVSTVSGAGQLRFDGRHHPQLTPVVGDDAGAIVAVRRLGKGEIVYVSDESLFTNARLAKADNARLALDLAGTGRKGRGFVAFEELTHGYDAGDSLWEVLPWPARAAIVIAAAALSLLLVGEFFRFGPTAPVLVDDERSSAEYLTSVANLLSRGKAARISLRDLAALCVRDVAASLGLAENAPIRTIAARLEAAHGDSVAALYELTRLRAKEYPTDAELVRAARLALTIRKDIVAHARIGFGRRSPVIRRTA